MEVDKMIVGAPRPATLLSETTAAQATSTPGSFRTLDGIRPTDQLNYVKQPPSRPSSSDVWAGAIARLQTQVSSNTSMLETQRRQLFDMERAVHRLHSDMEAVVAAVRELNAKLSVSVRHDHDPADLDVLAGQVSAVTNKLNEVESLRMQMELLKNRMKRLESLDSPAVRTDTSSSRRDHYDYPPNSHHDQSSHPQTLPPMRPNSIPPPAGYPHPLPGPQLLSQAALTAAVPPVAPESRYAHGEYRSAHASPAQTYRPNETLPPASTVSGWRPAEPVPPHVSPAVPPPRDSPHAPQAHSQPPHAGWATVNQPSKRSHEEQRPYEVASQPTSPKRPRLAPIMPRSNIGDDGHVHTPSSGQHTASAGTSEASLQARPRVPSNDSQIHAPSAYTPVSATGGYRFITPIFPGDGQTTWRPETDYAPRQQPQPSTATRGKGRGGRGRGRGNKITGATTHQQTTSQEQGPSGWDKESWQPSQHATSPRSTTHLAPTLQQPATHSPLSNTAPDHHELPTTPLSVPHLQPFSNPSELGPSNATLSSNMSSSGKKKARSKPIRNAEGILIRKDGRPDMRSVSSANNLRKVHAKKEAEKAHSAELEVEGEGKTPTSGKFLALAHSNSLSEDEHTAMMSRTGTPASMREGEDEGEEMEVEMEEEERPEKEAADAEDEHRQSGREGVQGDGEEDHGVEAKAVGARLASDEQAEDGEVEHSKKVNGVVAHERDERGGSINAAEEVAQ